MHDVCGEALLGKNSTKEREQVSINIQCTW